MCVCVTLIDWRTVHGEPDRLLPVAVIGSSNFMILKRKKRMKEVDE